jgi:hypothetical protein
MSRMNAITERWVLTCRRELLDRTLIWNQRHLLHALREFEQFYNSYRLTRASPTPGPCKHFPRLSPGQTPTRSSISAGATASAASSTSTSMPPDQHGCNYRHGHRLEAGAVGGHHGGIDVAVRAEGRHRLRWAGSLVRLVRRGPTPNRWYRRSLRNLTVAN